MFHLLSLIHRWINPKISYTAKIYAGSDNHSDAQSQTLEREENHKINCIIYPKIKFPSWFYPKLLGFYMVEIRHRIESINSKGITLIISDGQPGNDSSKQCDMKIRMSKSKLVKRIILIKKPISLNELVILAVSEETLDESVLFEFILVKISDGFAKDRIKKKLAIRNYQYIDFDRTPVKDCFKEYSRLFEPRKTPRYDEWIALVEPQSWRPKYSGKPFHFSIVVPVHNTPETWLRACIDSVIDQSYINWQLVLVDDGSSEKSIRELLSQYSNADIRIDTIYSETSEHICRATNKGIDYCKGDYILFLDHDDELSRHALNEMAHVLLENPNVKFIYSDEDLISAEGKRVLPHFKPDWNPELLLAHNYVTHLTCYESGTLMQLGGLRDGTEGAQDFDLVLRAKHLLTEQEIYHIPKVLYHWRMVEGSTALDSGAKNYATESGLAALKYHCEALGNNVNIGHSAHTNFYKVSWPLPNKLLMLSIIIPNKNCKSLLEACLESIFKTADWSNYEVIIVDNGSTCPETLKYYSYLAKDESIKIIYKPIPFNFSLLNNYGVRQASGEFLLLLNNDVEALEPGWMSEMLSLVNRAEVGCVGAKLLYPDGTIQHAGIVMGLGGYAAHSHRGFPGNESGYINRLNVRQNYSAVTAACLMIRKSVYVEVGGMDESYEVAYNDVDFCLRVLEKGYKNVFTPYATLLHHESKTRGEDSSSEQIERFDKEKKLLLDRWADIINHDPAYNPNLTRSHEDFSYFI